MLSTRSGRVTWSMNSLVGYDEELLARIASASAVLSRSAKTRFFSSRRSGTDSTTSQAPASASARSVVAVTVPGVPPSMPAATSATCCST